MQEYSHRWSVHSEYMLISGPHSKLHAWVFRSACLALLLTCTAWTCEWCVHSLRVAHTAVVGRNRAHLKTSRNSSIHTTQSSSTDYVAHSPIRLCDPLSLPHCHSEGAPLEAVECPWCAVCWRRGQPHHTEQHRTPTGLTSD